MLESNSWLKNYINKWQFMIITITAAAKGDLIPKNELVSTDLVRIVSLQYIQTPVIQSLSVDVTSIIQIIKEIRLRKKIAVALPGERPGPVSHFWPQASYSFPTRSNAAASSWMRIGLAT